MRTGNNTIQLNLVIFVFIFSTFLTTQTTNAAARATLAVLIMAILTVDGVVTTSYTRRHVRSAAHGDLVELRCRTTRYGNKVSRSAPLMCKSLPTTVHDISISVNGFCEHFKAELFRRAYGTDLVPM